MAYEQTEWKSGDVVTSEKLNKIENGIAGAGGVLVVTMSGDPLTSDKTWQEIYDAANSGMFVVTKYGSDDGVKPAFLSEAVGYEGDSYFAAFVNVDGATLGLNARTFVAESADDYPVYSEG